MQYDVLLNKHESYFSAKRHKVPERSFRINLLVKLSKIVGVRDTPLFQLLLFSKVKNYIRFIFLSQVYKNFIDVKEITKSDCYNHNIFNSFMDLGIQLEMISQNGETYSLNKKYIVDEINKNQLINLVNGDYNKEVTTLFYDYHFIENAITQKEHTSLGKLMRKTEFVYIKEVLTYLQEINGLDLCQQVSPSFSENFYTNLGELAFNIYTKNNYVSFISKKQITSFLDIGCGNGNYIDIHLDSNDIKIVGVERQQEVFEKLLHKYKDRNNVELYNDDIKNLTFNTKFDMINMSYMLFYLNQEEKEDLFKKLKEILDKNGSIVICQYYPDFEMYQELIAKHNKKWNLLSRYKYDICNSILQAEVLLNNMLTDFAQAEQWNPFLDLLDSHGFKVSEIVPADDTYYSYFITINHKNGGSND
ncbi:class I SAM-dependent methyltransferase [Shouchella tritolerans]|uniref:class I SAM-dependent methyltransferase n=1 Tax=Shouchella tritolerans TaxID=2979466 RepID=UPI0021E91FE1|nr:class I SAM-dependent methyltransferase [Shouchella tritolerans]